MIGQERQLIIEPLPPCCVLVLDGNVVGELAILGRALGVPMTMRLHEFKSEQAGSAVACGHLLSLTVTEVIL